jgi:tellurite resistance-related uncharacterized protein
MKSIPAGMRAYKKTAVFHRDTIPAGLQKSHTTKPGVWGKIVVRSGTLEYRILGDAPEQHVLSPGRPGIVEATVPHEVRATGPVEFFVEFYKLPE